MPAPACPPFRAAPCRTRLAALGAVAFAVLQGCTVALPSLWERANVAPPQTEQPRQAAAVPDDQVTTGSVRRAPEAATAPSAVTPAGPLPIPQADWNAAKAVLMEALADRADTPSLPWTNAQSGMSGTVTALQRAGGTSARPAATSSAAPSRMARRSGSTAAPAARPGPGPWSNCAPGGGPDRLIANL